MKPILAIIDDNVMMRTFLQEYFRKDFAVRVFSDAREARKWLDQGNFPDLITVDIKMPGLSGEEFLTQLKSSALFSEIPVLVLSGMKNSPQRVRCLELGAADYIVKPFNPRELELRIRKELGRIEGFKD